MFLSVCHAASVCKNSWTDRGPVWGEDSWRPKEHCVRRGSWSTAARGSTFDVAFAKLLWPLVNSVVEMLGYVLVAVLVVTQSWSVTRATKTSSLSTVRPTDADDLDSCKLALPVGCSCVQDRTAISVECSGAQMTSVPKHWFGSGNLVVKTLNLERNNISEVRNCKQLQELDDAFKWRVRLHLRGLSGGFVRGGSDGGTKNKRGPANPVLQSQNHRHTARPKSIVSPAYSIGVEGIMIITRIDFVVL